MVDKYLNMAEQPQPHVEFSSATYVPSISAPATAFTPMQESNLTIDPILQTTGRSVSSAQGFVPNQYSFTPPQDIGINGNGMSVAGPDGQSLRIPQEFLEGFPWNYGFSQWLGQGLL